MGIEIINQTIINDSLKSVNDTNTFYLDARNQIIREKQTIQKSLFTSHELGFKSFSPNPIPENNKDWISYTLFACLILFVFIKLFYRSEILKIYKSFFSRKIFYQYSREGQILKNQIFLPLILLFIITTSFIVYQLFCLYTNSVLGRPDSFIIFSKIFLFISLFLAYKLLTIIVLKSVFKIKDKNNVISLNIIIFESFTGIISLFLLIFSTFIFIKFFIILNLIILGIIFIYKIQRNLLIGLSYSNFSVLYNILYLCSVEILPLLLLVKLIINYFIFIK